MKADKIRQLDTAEIEKQLKEGLEKAFRIRFQLRMGQTDGIKNLRELRKDRARQLTVLRERSLGLAKPAAVAPPKAAKKSAGRKTEAKG
jgi:large subunit ribosomal protein L29